jgi:phenylacetaldehyde dehydrogenase
VFVETDVELPAAVKRFLDRPSRPMLIGDGWTTATSGRTLDVTDPATARVIANVPDADEEDVDAAVRAARSALDDAWGRLMPVERQDLMLRLADFIADHGEEIAHLEALEQGKLLEFSRLIEVDMAVDYIRYMAGWCTKIEGTTFDISPRQPEGVRYHAFTRREPVGVVAGIVPWNFPHLMAVWKIAPALATGCTIILKPAEETPLTALLLGELILEAGFPSGVVNIVTGYGETAGAALVRHPGIDKVAFTGSTEVGKQIGVEALKNMTRVSLELGGKSPVLVLDDAGPDFIASGLIGGLFFNSGQQCVAGSRLYAPRARFEEIVGRIADYADFLKLGSPFDPNVHIGPLVSKAQQDRVLGYIESGRQDGAEVVVGGKSPPGSGFFVEPTVIVNTDHEMKIVREEIFGPVLVAMPYSDVDDLVAKANDTDYGLAASVWGQNISRVLELLPRIKAGTIWVNTHSILDANMPFGGFKMSGVGREHGRAAIEQYTESKTVCVAY